MNRRVVSMARRVVREPVLDAHARDLLRRRGMPTASLAGAILLVAVLAGPASLAAQDATAAAREHYERGVGLFDEGQFAGALAEFEAAYALEPRPALLFNIGQIHGRLGHAVESADTLERYLAEMGATVPEERRALVEGELATQRSRIGRVTVDVEIAGARVSLDDVERGTTPLSGPLRASAGEHVLAVSAEGHETSRQRFRLAGGEERALHVALVRVSSDVVHDRPAERPFPALTVVGAVSGGLGLATFGVGGVVTLLEHASLTSGASACSPGCSAERTATIDASRVVADVGLAVLVVGGVLAVVGAVLELGGAAETEGPRVSFGAGDVEVWW